ncbi:ribonuclease HI family protein [Patescibacteria group bacterium]|nr:ribonuclease HI family protein [Patescibacteria group bacterium]MBU1889890.1 ribonuclease HI family protein [Patescibacteria group bacterium]
MKYEKLIIYSDGGARGNPGPAAVGVFLYDPNKVIVNTISECIGDTTNNQAEYQAIIKGLERAKDLGAEDLKCYLDSELVVNQLKLKYKVKNQGLSPLFVKAWNLVQQFKKVEFFAISREQNKAADRLVNEALDKNV